MEVAGDRLRSQIRALQASSLLLDSEDVGGFKIHDLVHEFVTSVSLTDHPLLVLEDQAKSVIKSQEDKLKSCEAMCFPDMKELPQELCCPELRVFLLFSNNESAEVPDSYFNSMRKLAVLNLTSIRLTRLRTTPCQFSENLHTLCLQRCSLGDVAILGKLKGLQILRIVNSDIQRLPKEIGQLEELRSLDLSGCYRLEIIEPGVLGSLTRLEELYMKGSSFDRWNAVEQTPPTNASLIELNNMDNLRTLHVSIPDPSMLPKDMNFKQLTKYEIEIGYTEWRRLRVSNGSRTLDLLNPTSDFLRKECIQSILRKTDELLLNEFNGSEQSIDRLYLEGFPHLKHLEVENSPSICYILERSSLPTTLPTNALERNALETLRLYKLVNLEKIINNNISAKSFSTLKKIRVTQCSKMEVLFPCSVVRELPQLEEIGVDGCKLMRGIVEADDDRGKLEFPKLRVLGLRDLPNIKNFIITGSAPSSSTLDGQVGTQIAFFSRQQVDFPRLETLEVHGLGNVRFIFSPFTVKSLVQLRKLSVRECKKMEAIIMEEEGSGVEISETLIFSMLTDLSLGYLESLTCFSHGSRESQSQDRVKPHSSALFNQEVAFSRLETLEILKLDNLRFMFSPSTVKSLTQLRKLRVRNCKKMEAIIMEEKGSGVETSETSAFPMLIDICLDRLESLTCFSCKKCAHEGRSQDHIQLHSDALFNRKVAFSKLESLEITFCHNLRFMFSPSAVRSFTQLRKLSVRYCKKMEAVIMEEEGSGMETSETLAFSMLTDLSLVYLESLTRFFQGSQETQSQDHVKSRSSLLFSREVVFPRLETLEIDRLDNVRFMFSPSTVRSLTQLRELKVSSSEKMEAIIMEEEGFGMEISETLEFSMLTDLSLVGLGSLTCFSIKKCSQESRRQDHIQLHSSTLFNRTVAFPRLEKLKIDGLDNLRFTFFPSMVKSLTQLKILRVSNCEKMEAIIMEDERSRVEISETPAFPMLTNLSLAKLGSLTCFSLEKCSREGWSQDKVQLHSNALFNREVAFPSLETLRIDCMDSIEMIWDNRVAADSFSKLKSLCVDGCKILTPLFPASIVGDLMQLEELEIRECGIAELIEKEEGVLFPKFVFPNLTSLKLKHLSELKSLYSETHTSHWPALKTLKMDNCNKVEILASQIEDDIPRHKQSLFLIEKVRPKIICFHSMVDI